MARIFDKIDQELLAALRATLEVSQRSDFCVGYLNLRGWQSIDDLIQPWDAASGQICRVLVGMQRPPHEEIRELYRAAGENGLIDNATAVRLRTQFAAHLREQITMGIPSGKDEAGLRRLALQLRAGQVVVKLFLPYPLHAKLYLLFRDDVNNPITGFVGSSNLTLQGLARQGELNVDVLDHHATQRLAKWFDDRWGERWALDVSADLAEIIGTSWARETPIPPYHIYLNIAYHLSTEARAGLSQFRLPGRFENELFEFQKSAVKIAARHLHRRGGVMIGDVVGLGKTMMATALARMFEDDLGYETLIICPKNLEPMWEQYRTEYGLRGMVLPISLVTRKLPDLKRYRLVLIDDNAGRAPIMDDLEALVCEGHTTGQFLPLVGKSDRRALYTADMVPTAAHVRMPWIMGYDLRPIEMLDEKRRLLSMCADEGVTVVYEHDVTVPRSGIARDGDDFQPIITSKSPLTPAGASHGG